MVGLIWREFRVSRQQSFPLTLAAETVEEQFDRLAGKDGVRLKEVELMGTGVLDITAYQDSGDKLLIDISQNVPPVNAVIGKNPIEHILAAVKERLKRASQVETRTLDGKEREENHHLDDLRTGKLAVGFLFESHLPFRDVYGSKNAHYPLYAEPASTFREKIAQLRNDLPILVHARSIFLFCNTNILKTNEIIKCFKGFHPSYFVFNYLRNLSKEYYMLFDLENMTMKLRNIPFSPPDMTEAEADEVREAILSGWITTGPRTKELEKLIAGYVGTEKAVCLNSATAALEMALHLLGVGPGDEVIVPAYTYTASASVVAHVGARLVLVDIQSDCLEMDYDKVSAVITEHTKVIIPVDLGGIVCDYDKIFSVVESKKELYVPANDAQRKLGRIAVCADCAHALGASRHGKMAGSIADFSSFSFHAVKNFTTAEGGALVWNLPFGGETVERLQIYCDSPVPFIEGETWNEFFYRLAQLFSLHGQNKDALAKTKLGAWEYDIIGPWYKCNMTDVLAAIGLIQFERYPSLLARRRAMIEKMDTAFSSLNVKVLKHFGPDWNSSGHLYIVRVLGKTREETNRIIEQMSERGIATNVHYKPLPMMTAYKAMEYDITDFPNAYRAFENEITLPLNTKMSDRDVDYVIENFINIVLHS